MGAMETTPISSREPSAPINHLPLVLVVIGTRPEAIKLAPVILELKRSPHLRVEVVLTGQHQDLVRPMLALFGLTGDHDLAVMEPAQSLASVTARILTGLDGLLLSRRPAMVVGQGDTASVLAASMASFFRQIPFAHVEAGLRTGNRLSPFPEEMNRVVTARYSSLHFAPTEKNVESLRLEGVQPSEVWVTGNTVIDALLQILGGERPRLPSRGRPFLLVTVHRRENHGEPLSEICEALAEIARLYPEIDIVLPVHPNPHVCGEIETRLGSIPNVILCPPQPYDVFCWLMRECLLILSDSGGVQEEAPALGKPVLVLREETERPEAVALGANRLVGTSKSRIIEECLALLEQREVYRAMAEAGSPYGDGRAASRISTVIEAFLHRGAV